MLRNYDTKHIILLMTKFKDWRIGIVTVGIFLVPLGYLTYQTFFESHNQMYQSALVRYADTNHNGHISSDEEKQFISNLFREINCTIEPAYVPNRNPRCSDGREITDSLLENLIVKKYGSIK